MQIFYANHLIGVCLPLDALFEFRTPVKMLRYHANVTDMQSF